MKSDVLKQIGQIICSSLGIFILLHNIKVMPRPAVTLNPPNLKLLKVTHFTYLLEEKDGYSSRPQISLGRPLIPLVVTIQLREYKASRKMLPNSQETSSTSYYSPPIHS